MAPSKIPSSSAAATSDISRRALPVSQKGTSTPFDIHIQKHALNIDRRGHKRIPGVDMEILCLGLSRTATASLRHALFILGYFDVYHGSSFTNENPRDCWLWAEAMRMEFENEFVWEGTPGYGEAEGKVEMKFDEEGESKGEVRKGRWRYKVWGREEWDWLFGHCMVRTPPLPFYFALPLRHDQ
jgi:hypothetical protein